MSFFFLITSIVTNENILRYVFWLWTHSFAVYTCVWMRSVTITKPNRANARQWVCWTSRQIPIHLHKHTVHSECDNCWLVLHVCSTVAYRALCMRHSSLNRFENILSHKSFRLVYRCSPSVLDHSVEKRWSEYSSCNYLSFSHTHS